MLLLVTIGLVVVGAIALVIGFVSNSLGPIYISIACSVIAGVVLVVFSRMARRKEGAPAPAARAAAPSPGSWAPASPPPTSPPPPPPPVTRVEPVPAPPRRPEPVRTMTTPKAATTFTAPRGSDVDDLDFPVADYDNLRASQILDQLDDLTLDELDMVREREEQGKNRATIIRRVDLRIDALEAEEDGDAASMAAGGPAPAEPFPALGEDEREPAGADDFPIANYDQLSTDEIISMLDDLDDDELDMVAEREEQGRNRLEILDYIDEMFEEVGPDGQPVPAAASPARGAAAPAAGKAAGKKAVAKKAVAKKAAVKKIATPVAGATKATRAAKKAPGRPAAAKAAAAPAPAGARKTAGAAKKAAAGASPGTKSAARPTAAPAKATAGGAATKKAVKAAAKKVPPAKKR